MIKLKNPTDSKKFYIGVRSCKSTPEEDFYFGSCKPLKSWIAKNGHDQVEKIILALWPSRKEAVSHEILLHDCFNVSHNKEFWNKVKQTTTKFDTTGISPWNKGGSLSPEHIEKMRIRALGNTNRRGSKHTEEAKEKNRLAHIGKAYHTTPHSEETKRKISLANKGKRVAIATEFAPGHIPWNKGKSLSAETRKKISDAVRLRNKQKGELTCQE
jgi:hypothetical protein